MLSRDHHKLISLVSVVVPSIHKHIYFPFGNLLSVLPSRIQIPQPSVRPIVKCLLEWMQHFRIFFNTILDIREIMLHLVRRSILHSLYLIVQ